MNEFNIPLLIRGEIKKLRKSNYKNVKTLQIEKSINRKTPENCKKKLCKNPFTNSIKKTYPTHTEPPKTPHTFLSTNHPIPFNSIQK
jgi:hypothetical protein